MGMETASPAGTGLVGDETPLLETAPTPGQGRGALRWAQHPWMLPGAPRLPQRVSVGRKRWCWW